MSNFGYQIYHTLYLNILKYSSLDSGWKKLLIPIWIATRDYKDHKVAAGEKGWRWLGTALKWIESTRHVDRHQYILQIVLMWKNRIQTVKHFFPPMHCIIKMHCKRFAVCLNVHGIQLLLCISCNRQSCTWCWGKFIGMTCRRFRFKQARSKIVI